MRNTKNHITRRSFVKNTGSLLLFALANNNISFIINKPLLSFSTLGCPDWSFRHDCKLCSRQWVQWH